MAAAQQIQPPGQYYTGHHHPMQAHHPQILQFNGRSYVAAPAGSSGQSGKYAQIVVPNTLPLQSQQQIQIVPQQQAQAVLRTAGGQQSIHSPHSVIPLASLMHSHHHGMHGQNDASLSPSPSASPPNVAGANGNYYELMPPMQGGEQQAMSNMQGQVMSEQGSPDLSGGKSVELNSPDTPTRAQSLGGSSSLQHQNVSPDICKVILKSLTLAVM